MKLFVVVHLALVAAFVSPLPAHVGQDTRPRHANTPTTTDSVKLWADLVTMDVQVVQKDTATSVGDLTKDDFVLYEDGTKQEISQFGRGSLPLSVLLLIDRAGCLDPINDRVKDATLAALHRLKATDEVALMAYAEHTELVKGFSLNHDAIAAAFDRIPPHDEEAEHCLNVAVSEAASYMMHSSNPYGRRVIIFITGVTRAVDCGSPSNEEALQEVLESGSVVCTVLPRSAGQRMENGLMIGILGTAGKFGVPTTNLDKLAEETGGEVVSAKTEELNTKFNGLIERLRTRYALGFASTNTKYDGAFRKLKLELTPAAQKRLGKKAVVQTRRGYLATPPRQSPAETP